MILIASSPADGHADHVEECLTARGAAFLRYDPADFPAASSFGIDCLPGGGVAARLRRGAASIDLSDVDCVWYRRPGLSNADAAMRPWLAGIEAECDDFVRDLWSTLDSRFVPGRPLVIRQAQMKMSQLRVAGTLGFALPPTLVTNDPAEMLDFYRRHDGRVISKQAGFSLLLGLPTKTYRFTELVSHRDLARAESLRYCPVIFQAYVPKAFELRITVVDRRVFAAEIDSQATHHTRIDWRRYDHYHTTYRPHALPAEVERRCLALVARLGLAYGAIDMIVTPEGEYVFLEINPNGQYLWVEHKSGLPITDALCDLLIDGPTMPQPPIGSTGGAHATPTHPTTTHHVAAGLPAGSKEPRP